MWFTEKSVTDELQFKTWSGKNRSLFYEKEAYYCPAAELSSSEKGGVSIASGYKVNISIVEIYLSGCEKSLEVVLSVGKGE